MRRNHDDLKINLRKKVTRVQVFERNCENFDCNTLTHFIRHGNLHELRNELWLIGHSYRINEESLKKSSLNYHISMLTMLPSGDLLNFGYKIMQK